jgi:branched-chain amino acid transport system ATP-binding protein
MADAGAPLLAVKDLHVHYGAIHAIQGISVEVYEKEIVTLIGANGAGKSTTLRTISGLLRPSGGSVRLDGLDLARMAPHAIVAAGVSHVPEGRRVFANMPVRENLELGAFIRKDARAIRSDMERVFDIFPRLRERAGQRAGTLSGGEQQMLSIGRALMSQPRLLLLDEPSLGLAPFLVQEIFKIVRQINDRGTTILLVEQNAHAALQIADRGYVIETGRVALADSSRRLLENEDVRKAYLGEA